MHTNSQNQITGNGVLRNQAVLNAPIPLMTRNIVLLFIIGVVIVLWSNGFNLKVFHLSDRFEILLIAATFTLVACVVFRTPLFFSRGVYRNVYAWSTFGIIGIACFSILLNSVLIGGQSLVEVPRQGFLYCGLLVCVLMLTCRTDSSFVLSLNALVVGISIANVLFLIALSFMPGIAANLLHTISSRFGQVRFVSPLEPMISYSTLYCLVMCVSGTRSNKTRLFFASLLLACLWYFLFVDMGRRVIFVLIIIGGYYWLFHLGIGRKTILLLASFLILIASVAFMRNSVFDAFGNVVYSVKEELEGGEGTVGVRIDGIRYYMEQFSKGGYVGIGPATHGLTEAKYLIYNPNDHGLIAVLYQNGFQAIALTLVILFMLFRDLRTIRRSGPRQFQAIAMAIWLYLCFCIIGLSQIFWKPSFALWTGIVIFMVWRMRDEMRCSRNPIRQ